jgi:hypothetical protein
MELRAASQIKIFKGIGISSGEWETHPPMKEQYAKKEVGESLEPYLTGGDQGGGFPPYHWRARFARQT